MSGGLWRYVVLRVLRAGATVWGVCTLVFLLVHLMPGDPVDAILGDQAAPEDRAALRVALRLDRPLPLQYTAFLGDVADGSLGHSFRSHSRRVSSLLVEVLPHTAALALASMLLALCLALPLGALAALRRGTGVDRAASTVAMLGIAIPHIWLGPLLVLGFGVFLRALPLPGDDPTRPLGLILPAFTVGSALIAILTRQTRAALIEVLGEQYITAARARGVRPLRLMFLHALPNALLPVMTVAAAQLGALLGGAVIAEKIFERPGLGTLFLEAFFDRDIPVVQGCVLVVAVIYVLVNLGVDLLYGVVDPRVRVGVKRLRRNLSPGVLLVGAFALCALFGPFLAPYSPLAIDLDMQYAAPSARHWLGTTDNGVDVLSVLLYGARLSGIVALASVSLSLLSGAAIGAVAGYRGGRTDHVLSGISDLVQAFPSIVLNIAILALVSKPSVLHVVLALSANGWVLFARIARAQTLLLRESDFVSAARLLGASESQVLWHHVAPNVASALLVQATSALGAAVLAESTLSFLGLGPGTVASWGALLDQGSAVLLRFPRVALIAGSAIALTVLGFNLAGDFLRDRLDPKLRAR